MNLLHAAAECFPLIKTGGLADVLGALPTAQRALGVDARVVLPAYRGLPPQLQGLTRVAALQVRGFDLEILLGTIGTSRATGAQPVYLVACPALFDREGDPYRDAGGQEFRDNAQRFGIFGEAVARLAAGGLPDFAPQVLHLHDWQSGLAAAWMQTAPARPRLLFTIHNLAYQGLFDRATFEASGLPEGLWSPQGLEFWGGLSFMKAGLVYADALTTVSPTYAREIQTPAHGCALDGVLRDRAGMLEGILNGIDETVWNPATDLLLRSRYDAAKVEEGKRANKYALQADLGLTLGDWPLIAFIGRLAQQKGADLILAARDAILGSSAQLAVLASGEARLEREFRELAQQATPGRVAVTIAHDEALAHRLTAAADLLLMPSRYEPCGLNQMYAQRYGAVPVVHRTGGLADTVIDATAANLANGSATGVQFEHADTGGLGYGIRRGLELIEDSSSRRFLRAAGMQRDFSWRQSAGQYVALYCKLLA